MSAVGSVHPGIVTTQNQVNGSKSAGAYCGPSPPPLSLSIFQSPTSQVLEEDVPHTRSALPSSNSCPVPEPSSPTTPNISIILPSGANRAILSSPLESAGPPVPIL